LWRRATLGVSRGVRSRSGSFGAGADLKGEVIDTDEALISAAENTPSLLGVKSQHTRGLLGRISMPTIQHVTTVCETRLVFLAKRSRVAIHRLHNSAELEEMAGKFFVIGKTCLPCGIPLNRAITAAMHRLLACFITLVPLFHAI
jgi:hypothetical protein